MLVQAKPGTRCPKEGKPREYITEEAVDVPDTTYYRRLIAEGSLIETQNKKTVKREERKVKEQ
ncbi:hypothetical protein ASZ90_007849 [hydrocarbon metagenome]|uniref:DUF2635 domain-containing protein n=1 Tax=hydrocarbon metagenome TaxID=938273 RepID=A0A0W8FNR6_9ZZZZ